MPLITCDECGKEISSRAESCPHCGCPSQYTLESHHKEQEQVEEEKEETSPDTRHRPIISRKISLLIYAMVVLFGVNQIGESFDSLNAEMLEHGKMHEEMGQEMAYWWNQRADDLETTKGMGILGAGARAIGDVKLAEGQLQSDRTAHTANAEAVFRESWASLSWTGLTNTAQEEMEEETAEEQRNLAQKTEILRNEIKKLAGTMGRLDGTLIHFEEDRIKDVREKKGYRVASVAHTKDVNTMGRGDMELTYKRLVKDFVKMSRERTQQLAISEAISELRDRLAMDRAAVTAQKTGSTPQGALERSQRVARAITLTNPRLMPTNAKGGAFNPERFVGGERGFVQAMQKLETIDPASFTNWQKARRAKPGDKAAEGTGELGQLSYHDYLKVVTTPAVSAVAIENKKTDPTQFKEWLSDPLANRPPNTNKQFEVAMGIYLEISAALKNTRSGKQVKEMDIPTKREYVENLEASKVLGPIYAIYKKEAGPAGFKEWATVKKPEISIKKAAVIVRKQTIKQLEIAIEKAEVILRNQEGGKK